MRSRRANISIYIIIGIITVLWFGTLYYIFTNRDVIVEFGKKAGTPAELTSVKTFLDDCLDISLKRAIHLSAVRGGVIYGVADRIIYEGESIPYYETLAGISIPTEEKLSSDLLRFVESDILLCIEEEKNGLLAPYTLEMSKFEGDLRFEDGKTTAEIKWPIRVTGEQRTTLFTDFSTEYYVDLNELRKLAARITSLQRAEQEIGIPDLKGKALQIFPVDSTSTVYSLTDSSAGTTLVFFFAVQKVSNRAPILGITTEIKGYVGKELRIPFTVFDPEGDFVTTTVDNHQAFFSDENNELIVIPAKPGKFSITLRATDTHANVDEKKMRFYIDEPSSEAAIIIEDVKIIAPVHTDISFEIPVYSKRAEKIICEVDNPLLLIVEQCKVKLDAFRNLASGELVSNIWAHDESGNTAQALLVIDVRETDLFSIEPIGRKQAKVGEEFVLQLQINHEDEIVVSQYPLNFSDNAEQFEITQKGLIKFVPLKAENITAIVEVRDIFGNAQATEFIIEVRNE